MGLGDEFDGAAPDAVEKNDARYDDQLSGETHEMSTLRASYAAWREGVTEKASYDHESLYDAAMDAIDTFEEDTLYSFCSTADLEGPDGLFVSAAAEAVDGEHVTLPDMEDVDYVGIYGETDLTVAGSTGEFVGRERQGGKMVIEGDADDWAGMRLRGGEIEIKGSTGINTGAVMEDGVIRVGRAGSLGQGTEGGLIYVDEEMELGSPVGDATVYVRRDGEYVEQELPVEANDDDEPGPGIDNWKDVW